MNNGKTIQELAIELDRRANLKRDFVLSTDELNMGIAGEGDNVQTYLDVPGHAILDINDHAHHQIASRVNIPRRYYDTMKNEAPELMVRNVNHWFHEKPARRMIRTIDGMSRAFLSDRYLRIENEDVAAHVMQTLINDDHKPYPISTEVTDRKLYLKFLFEDMEADIVNGDSVKPGIVISNSEVGTGSYEVKAFFYRDFCTNGCVFGTKDIGLGVRRHHVGEKIVEGVDYQVFSNETQKLVHEGLMAQTNDIITATADPVFFNQMVSKLRTTTEGEKIINPEAGVQVLAKEFNLNETERSKALINLVSDGDYSRWGALNAVTKIANEVECYDRASEIENIGAKIIEMGMRSWSTIANAERVAA